MKTTIRVLKRILVIIMIITILNNFAITPVVKANETLDAIGETITGFFLSFLGLLTLPARAIALGVGYAINALTATVAYIEGATDPTIKTYTITPFDIFFNKVKILDINFFEIGNDVNIVNTIRTGIAAWYYALRLIAMAILLVILIYVGIRMAISTIATDKAVYKRMLFDWVVSLVLIFLTNYIIIFVISLNNMVVEAIEKGVNAESISETYDAIGNLGFKWIDINSIPATVIFCMLVAQTLGLVITYFNRMLKVAFLIIISPLITLTYAVDKMGDGKAQALGNWIKEFVFTVITQIFHCIIYMSMINVSFNILVNNSGTDIEDTLATAVMSILCVSFVKTAENLVRKILMHNHQDNSLSVAGGMAATAVALQKSKSLGTATRKAVNVTKGNLEAAGRAIKTVAKSPVTGAKAAVASVKTRKEMKAFMKTEEGQKIKAGMQKPDRKTYRSASKSQRREMKNTQKAYKVARKLKKSEIKAKHKSEINAAISNTGIAKVGRKITKPIGKVKDIKHRLNRIASQSSSYQVISSIAKTYTAAGVGLATGSMMYGSTGKVGQSVAMAAAGYQMHRGFQKSALTMENSTQSTLIGMGIKTKEKAVEVLDDVASNPVLYDGESAESIKQAETILKTIGDQLIQMVGNPEYKTRIRNEIDTMVAKNPESIPSTINSLMNEITTGRIPPDSSPEEKEKFQQNATNLRSACEAYADFASRKAIYSQMQSAQAMGISKDSYVQECTEGFVQTDNNETYDGDKRLDRMIESGKKSQEKITKQANSMKPEMVDAVSDAIEERRKFIEDAIRTSNDNEKRAFEEQLRDLERVEQAMSEAIIRDKDKALRESQRKILERVRQDCKKEIRRLVAEVEKIEQRPVEQTEDKEEISIMRSRINTVDNKVKSINDRLSQN